MRTDEFRPATPEALEAAAMRSLEMAAEMRAFDALEPQGDEPTICWSWRTQPGPMGANSDDYSYVAFKAPNGKWYTTAQTQTAGYSWRGLGSRDYAENLRKGDFLIVAKWEHV